MPGGVLSGDESHPDPIRMEDALPPDVFSRILTESGVWRVPDLGTFGPWNVSKAWRDAVWTDPEYPDHLARALLSAHGGGGDSVEVMRRAVFCSLCSTVVDLAKLAMRVFELVHGDGGIQEQQLGAAETGDVRDTFGCSPTPLPWVTPLWIPSPSMLITSVRVSCLWKDQGWGNRKGRIGLALLRGGCSGARQARQGSEDEVGSEAAGSRIARWMGRLAVGKWGHHDRGGMSTVEGSEFDLFGIAEHSEQAVSVLLDGSNAEFRSAILERQRPGDALMVFCVVGGGGGHLLHVPEFRIQVAHTEIAAGALRAAHRQQPVASA